MRSGLTAAMVVAVCCLPLQRCHAVIHGMQASLVYQAIIDSELVGDLDDRPACAGDEVRDV